MSSPKQLEIRSPRIHRSLGDLRTAIRRYVVVQGLAITTLWAGTCYWLLLAIDYLPVRLGLDELSVTVRFLLLSVVSAGILGIIWYFVIRRLKVPLADESLALLIERRDPAFRDSLVTICLLYTSPSPRD